jgi:hypothetical protein
VRKMCKGRNPKRKKVCPMTKTLTERPKAQKEMAKLSIVV